MSQSLIDGQQFETFWQAYPLKKDKGHARTAFQRALKKASATAIMNGLSRYRFSPHARFQPHAATWLNGERWDDASDDFDPVLRAVGLGPEDFTGGAGP